MVVHRNAQNLFRLVLPHNVFVKLGLHFGGLAHLKVERFRHVFALRLGVSQGYRVVENLDALRANCRAVRAGDKLAHDVNRTPAKTAFVFHYYASRFLSITLSTMP